MSRTNQESDFVDPGGGKPVTINKRGIMGIAMISAAAVVFMIASNNKGCRSEGGVGDYSDDPITRVKTTIDPFTMGGGPEADSNPWQIAEPPQTITPATRGRTAQDSIMRAQRLGMFTAALSAATVFGGQGQGRLDSILAPPPLERLPIQRLDNLTITQGILIEAVLITGLDSERPGPIIATVSQNVYDSQTYQNLLIPAGTRLIGSMEAARTGNNRSIVLAWERALFPNGTAMPLPGLPAIEKSGEAGVAANVKNYYGQVFGQAALLGLMGGGSALLGSQLGPEGFLLTAGPAMQMAGVAQDVVQRGFSRPPRVTVPAGYRFQVYVAQDLPFPHSYAQ